VCGGGEKGGVIDVEGVFAIVCGIKRVRKCVEGIDLFL